jgi:hypothetical protein
LRERLENPGTVLSLCGKKVDVQIHVDPETKDKYIVFSYWCSDRYFIKLSEEYIELNNLL